LFLRAPPARLLCVRSTTAGLAGNSEPVPGECGASAHRNFTDGRSVINFTDCAAACFISTGAFWVYLWTVVPLLEAGIGSLAW
jgi:hypothetical protein